MPETVIDVGALYAATDSKRQTQSLSWRELARELKVSPSTFTRMAQGHRPDVDTFATVLRWLSMPADAFMKPRPTEPQAETEPTAMISTYLRSARDLRPEDADAIAEIVRVAYKRLRSTTSE